MSTPKLTLYTSRYCPWAHRAQFALHELGLEYEEVIIDLTKPREPWYLEINPRGLVPTLKYGDEIIIESGIITQFLADLGPSQLAPNTGTAEAALARARINVFVDTFISKVTGPWTTVLYRSTSAEEAAENIKKIVAGVKEVAALLKDAAPYFGGSKRPTLAEINTASFVLRLYALGKEEGLGFEPGFLKELEEVPEWKKWKDAVLKEESLTKTFDEKDTIVLYKTKVAEMKAKAAK